MLRKIMSDLDNDALLSNAKLTTVQVKEHSRWKAALIIGSVFLITTVILFNVRAQEYIVPLISSVSYEAQTTESTNLIWQNVTDSQKAKKFAHHGILPAFKNVQTQIRFADRYGLSTCVISKTMSTVMSNVMCYLYDPEGFSKQDRSIIGDGYWTRFCDGLNEESDPDRLHRVYPGTQWNWFVVVRDPFDRFISNYIDKCIYERRKTGKACYDCEDEMDVGCVISGIEERAWKFVREGEQLNFFDLHLFPQNWQCNFGDYLNKYRLIHFHAPGSTEFRHMLDELVDVFRGSGVPEPQTKRIVKVLNRETTGHTTSSKPERRLLAKAILANGGLVRRFVNLYFFDYHLFGYPLPAGYRS